MAKGQRTSRGVLEAVPAAGATLATLPAPAGEASGAAAAAAAAAGSGGEAAAGAAAEGAADGKLEPLFLFIGGRAWRVVMASAHRGSVG